MEQVDVVVVGAGLAGLSVAWHLAAEMRVLVLEQGEQPGAEATAQNAGMVRRMGEDPCERALSLPRCRSVRWWVARGNIAYSAVSQPPPLSSRQRGTLPSMDTLQSTTV